MNWDNLSINSYWHDTHRILFNKDCRSMSDLPNGSVQCIVTSPPYWGLRKYAGLPDLVWGGSEDCQHEWGQEIETGDNRFRAPSGSIVGGDNNPEITKGGKMLSSFCSLCGAWQGQLGLEPTPELYIAHLIEIFREVRRVLRKDGVVFLNIGDSYNTSPAGNKQPLGFQQKSRAGLSGALAQFPFDHARYRLDNYAQKTKRSFGNLKPKDLCLIPFRLAIALQEDWWVRSVIIWSKNNPMPESVRDRPSESHEYILMLTKSAKYYYDQEAVREPYIREWDETNGGSFGKTNWILDAEGTQRIGKYPLPKTGRNLRSVWAFPTQSFSGAHFATFPEELVRRCVLASTPEVGCCSKCGKAWVRITKSIGTNKSNENAIKELDAKGIPRTTANLYATKDRGHNETLGWKPQCQCGLPQSDNIGSIVLDPFSGSGTTLKVAAELSRRAIGYELSEKYCHLVIERNRQGIIL